MERVGVALRFVAILIDGIIFFVVAFVLALFAGNTSNSSADGMHTVGFHLGGSGVLLVGVLSLGYYTICESLLGGTLGKLALGLRVVDEDGDEISFSAALVRNLLRIVDGLLFYLVGAIAIWSSADHQRLGDRAAHTYVVRRHS